MEFVTDRTEADVMLGNTKGRYTYRDLNRVERAVDELSNLAKKLDIHHDLVTKTDWSSPGMFSADGWPVESQMRRYLQNIHTLCGCFRITADLPDNMANLTYEGANKIESALEHVYQRVLSILQAYKFSGELYAGEENGL